MTLAEYELMKVTIEANYRNELINNQELFEDLNNPLRNNLRSYNSQYMRRMSICGNNLDDEDSEYILQELQTFRAECLPFRAFPGFTEGLETEAYGDGDGGVDIDDVCMRAFYYIPATFNSSVALNLARSTWAKALKGDIAGFTRGVSSTLFDSFLDGTCTFEEIQQQVYPNA